MFRWNRIQHIYTELYGYEHQNESAKNEKLNFQNPQIVLDEIFLLALALPNLTYLT